MIQFQECQTAGYPARTEENIINSDLTIAVAVDFKSAGERLTKQLCKASRKPYIDVHYAMLGSLDMAQTVAGYILVNGATKLNGAGNGIYTLKESQFEVNTKMCIFFSFVLAYLQSHKITSVRSGGQTGVDESFLIAAESQYIPEIICLAPKGWLFRDKNHNDIRDEKLFKERFKI